MQIKKATESMNQTLFQAEKDSSELKSKVQDPVKATTTKDVFENDTRTNEKQQIKETQAKIEKEREAAITNLVGSSVAAALRGSEIQFDRPVDASLSHTHCQRKFTS